LVRALHRNTDGGELPWATTPARHSFERFPATAEYGALVAEYQASAG
jgi:hypothetical protein